MTPNKEDYLKCIYEISTQNNKITNKEIAEKMSVSRPAVTGMIKNLLSEDFLVKSPLTGYHLTKSGLALVAALYRKHRLIEVFLVHHLGYTTEQIHEEAEVLEHTISERFVEHLDKFLNFPTICPHGGTIPKKGELLIEKYQQSLLKSPLGHYELKRVQDEFHLLKYLEENKFQLGQIFEISHQDDYSNTQTLYFNHKELIIPNTIAQHLYVEQVK